LSFPPAIYQALDILEEVNATSFSNQGLSFFIVKGLSKSLTEALASGNLLPLC
jgi:hypothetical protein